MWLFSRALGSETWAPNLVIVADVHEKLPERLPRRHAQFIVEPYRGCHHKGGREAFAPPRSSGEPVGFKPMTSRFVHHARPLRLALALYFQ